MFESLLQNKYFAIALILALLTLVYLYLQKDSCENMTGLDLTPLSHELTEVPWTTHSGKYKRVNNKFDKKADKATKEKLGDVKFLERSDQEFKAPDKTEADPEGMDKDELNKHAAIDDIACAPCKCDMLLSDD